MLEELFSSGRGSPGTRRRPRFQFVLLLSLILAAYLDGVFSRPFDWNVWRGGLQPPVIITYILVIYPLMQRLWDRAVRALAPLLDLDDSSRNDIVNGLNAVNHRSEWLAVILGASFWIALSQPWNWVEDWVDVYALVVQMTMFGLLGWLVNGGLSNTRQLTKLNRYVKLDINNPGAMAPVAQWSLGISFAFVGGITISVAFQPTDSLLEWQNIVIYAVLLSVTILIFFVSLWSTHGAMVRAKRSNAVPGQGEPGSGAPRTETVLGGPPGGHTSGAFAKPHNGCTTPTSSCAWGPRPCSPPSSTC